MILHGMKGKAPVRMHRGFFVVLSRNFRRPSCRTMLMPHLPLLYYGFRAKSLAGA